MGLAYSEDLYLCMLQASVVGDYCLPRGLPRNNWYAETGFWTLGLIQQGSSSMQAAMKIIATAIIELQTTALQLIPKCLPCAGRKTIIFSKIRFKALYVPGMEHI